MFCKIKLVSLLVMAVVAASACSSSVGNTAPINSPSSQNAEPSNSATSVSNDHSTETSSLNGKQIYTETCMICHRDTAKGGPTTIQGKRIKPANLTKPELKTWSDARWLKEVQEGDPEEGMPSFKTKLKPEEILAIAQYIRTLE